MVWTFLMKSRRKSTSRRRRRPSKTVNRRELKANPEIPRLAQFFNQARKPAPPIKVVSLCSLIHSARSRESVRQVMTEVNAIGTIGPANRRILKTTQRPRQIKIEAQSSEDYRSSN
jgi:hypothetical protein